MCIRDRSGLRDQGLLVERQAHVHGVSRKRKAYFLTDSGIIAAEETWERLRQFQFRCIGSDPFNSVATRTKSINASCCLGKLKREYTLNIKLPYE